MSRATDTRKPLSRSEMIAAGRTVMTAAFPLSLPDIADVAQTSKDSFVDVSNDNHAATEGSVADVGVSEDSFSDTDDCVAIRTVQLTQSDIIKISNSIIITLPGLNQFRSAFDFITQHAAETDFDFAMRRMSALTPAFIQTDPTHPLNDWHMANRKDANKVDEALAETAYFFDNANNRLIIRHTPVEAFDKETDRRSNELLENVTQRIILGLGLDRNTTRIEHVIPRIVAGRLSTFIAKSKHIVLQIKSENDLPKKSSDSDLSDASEEESTDVRIFDSRINLFNTSTHRSVGVQDFLNDLDCGRHVLIMATAAAKILAENSAKNANTMTIDDFLQFVEVVSAKECVTVTELKELLIQMGDPRLIASVTKKIAAQPVNTLESKPWCLFSALNSLSFLALNTPKPKSVLPDPPVASKSMVTSP